MPDKRRQRRQERRERHHDRRGEHPSPPSPPPVTPPPPPSGSGDLSALHGRIQTKRPNSNQPFSVPFENVSRWADLFTQAGDEFDMDPFFMGAMALIESDANQYWTGEVDGDRAEVVKRDDGFGDGWSVGLLQVKPSIWQSLVPDADAYTPEGNIRLGSAIMAKGIRERGSWQEAIKRDYFPTDDPNGTTQNAYIDTIRALVREMRANVADHGTSPGASGEKATFLSCLRAQEGKTYVHGTAGPDTFDCSGLIHFCYLKATGQEIPGGRGSWLQCNQAGRDLGRAPISSLKPGDLLCYLNGQHVGIYEGNNVMVNALNENEGVREDDITTSYWVSNYDGARRLWED